MSEQAISFRFDREKLEEILDMLGIGGKNLSEKIRNLFLSLSNEPTTVISNTPETEVSQENVLDQETQQFFDENPCFYRVIDGKYVYCDTTRLPAKVCAQRQKRYMSQNMKCRPKGLKRTKAVIENERKFEKRLEEQRKMMAEQEAWEWDEKRGVYVEKPKTEKDKYLWRYYRNQGYGWGEK